MIGRQQAEENDWWPVLLRQSDNAIASVRSRKIFLSLHQTLDCVSHGMVQAVAVQSGLSMRHQVRALANPEL